MAFPAVAGVGDDLRGCGSPESDPADAVRLKVRSDLEALRRAVLRCALCPAGERRFPGSGPVGAEVFLLAGLPGPGAVPSNPWGYWWDFMESELDSWGIKNDMVYFSTALRCQAEKVTAERLRRCAPYLAEEILLVRPRLVVVSGRVAAVALRLALGDEVPDGPRAGDVVSVYGTRFLFQIDVSRLPGDPRSVEIFRRVLGRGKELLKREDGKCSRGRSPDRS